MLIRNSYFKTIIVFAIIFLFGIKKQHAQSNTNATYSLPIDWENFLLVDTINCPISEKIFVVTNRELVRNAKKNVLLPNNLAKYRPVTYIIAHYTGSQWHLQLINSFEEGMRQVNNGNDIVFFVHGHGKSFPLAIGRTQHIKTRYNLVTVLFDWPSKNTELNFSFARVRYCSENFYNLLLQIEAYKNSQLINKQKLTLFCHSAGNYFISYLVVNGNHQFLNRIIFDNLILNSAAIKSKEHNEVIDRLHIAKNYYIIGNTKDWILHGAGFSANGKMLGFSFRPPYAQKALYFDFTPIAGKEHTFFAGHYSFEYSNPAVFGFYNTILHGHSINPTNNNYFFQIPNKPIYIVNEKLSLSSDSIATEVDKKEK